jgi:hypothetical protein
LIAAERSSSIFKHLGIWLKGKEYVTMDRILVADDPENLNDTTWSSIIEAQALVEVLTKDSQEHYHQAAETPFVSGPIVSKIGPFADNDYCDAVLNGTFEFEDLAERTEVQDLIKGMRYPDPTCRPNPGLVLTPLLPMKDSSLRSRIHRSAHHLHPPLEGIMDTAAPYYDLLPCLASLLHSLTFASNGA